MDSRVLRHAVLIQPAIRIPQGIPAYFGNTMNARAYREMPTCGRTALTSLVC